MTYVKKLATVTSRIMVHLRGLDQRMGLLGSLSHGVSASAGISVSSFLLVTFIRFCLFPKASGGSTVTPIVVAMRAARIAYLRNKGFDFATIKSP